MKFTCKGCGIESEAFPCQKRQYCSRECRNAQGRMKCICKRCGVEFSARVSQNPGYCSKACYHGQRINVECLRCGTSFERTENNPKKYCSCECVKLHKIENAMAACEYCGVVFRRKGSSRHDYSGPPLRTRFCSRKCGEIARRKAYSIPCEQCGTMFIIKPNQANKARFCSMRCRALKCNVGITVGIKMPTRKKTPKYYETGRWTNLARRVRKRDGYQCQKCGVAHPKGSRQLEVHHKLPVRLGGLDVMENLITLCVPCHRKTDAALRKAELDEKRVATGQLIQRELFDSL